MSTHKTGTSVPSSLDSPHALPTQDRPSNFQQMLDTAKWRRSIIREDIDKFCQKHGLSLAEFFRAGDLARSLETCNMTLQTYETIIETLEGSKANV